MTKTSAALNSPQTASSGGGKYTPQEIARLVRDPLVSPEFDTEDNPKRPVSLEEYRNTGKIVTVAENKGDGFPPQGSAVITPPDQMSYDYTNVAKTDPNLPAFDILKDPQQKEAAVAQQIFIKPLNSLGGATVGILEKVGKVAPGAFNDTKDAVGDLFGNYILGKQEKKASTKPEDEARKQAEKTFFIQSRQTAEGTEADIQRISQENVLKDVLRIGGEKVAAMSEEEQNRMRNIQASYRKMRPTSAHEAVEVRRILKDEEDAIKRVNDQQTMAQVSGKQNVVLDGMAEGGTGGGKINISSTGGGGIG